MNLIFQQLTFSTNLKRRLQTFLFVSPFVLFQCCLSVDKVRHVARQRALEIDNVKGSYSPSYLSIKTDSLPRQDSLVEVSELPSELLPLIFYWQDKRRFNCVLRSDVPVHIFSQEFVRLADSIKLPSRLMGKRLELSLLECPSGYIYTHKTEVVFLLIAAFTKEEDLVTPKEGQFRSTYKLWQDSLLIDEGVVTLPFIKAKEAG